MSDFMMEQWIYVARLIGAAVCGGLIGYERQSRKKTAGVRTHVIISVAAVTMMIISKYCFNDVLGEYVRLDPSRVAAGIVTAVGFIGSGIIFFRNNNVSGITTSAGIWATVGVGMAMGCGMYVLGVVSTAIVMVSEVFLGRRGYFSRKAGEERELEIEYKDSDKEDIFSYINKTIEDAGCRMENIKLTDEDSLCVLNAVLKAPDELDAALLVGELKKKKSVKRVSV